MKMAIVQIISPRSRIKLLKTFQNNSFIIVSHIRIQAEANNAKVTSKQK